MENSQHRSSRNHHFVPRLRRLTLRRNLLLSKSNPYVGCFRHSPPSSCSIRFDGDRSGNHSKATKRFASKSVASMKTSPYVGWFRHAPPSRLPLDTTTTTLAPTKLLPPAPALDLHELFFFQEPVTKLVVDGRLNGGSPSSWLMDRNALRQTLKESSLGSPSATVQILSRLATWFLFPQDDQDLDLDMKIFLQDVHRAAQVDQRLPNDDDENDEEEADDGGDVTHYDDDDDEEEEDDNTSVTSASDTSTAYTVGTHLYQHRQLYNNNNNNPASDDRVPLAAPLFSNIDRSISSLAEAYYAHQARQQQQPQHHLLIDDEDEYFQNDDARLDYVITQMDITRMARHASRHLDVESIFHLPTVTYRSSNSGGGSSSSGGASDGNSDDSSSVGNGDAVDASWMIVPPSSEEATNVCVICLEEFQDGDRLRVLPCNHTFHCGCVDRWLSGSHSFQDCFTSGCPTCKKRPQVTATATATPDVGDSVPSWAFCRLGDALAKSSSL